MTRKELRDYATLHSMPIIEVPFAGVQNFARFANLIGYNYGLYGWNWDAYDFGGFFIVCTGYRNTIGSEKYANILSDFDNSFRVVASKLTDQAEIERLFEQACAILYDKYMG